MKTIDELLHRDKALESTWNAYLDFLEDPALTPEQAEAFMDRLEQEPDAELGYCTRYLHMRANWLFRLDRPEDAAAAWIRGRMYGAGNNGNDWDLLNWLEIDPDIKDADRVYKRRLAAPLGWDMPLIWLERGPVRGRRKDALDDGILCKGDDAFHFRQYWISENTLLAVGPEAFEATPELVETRRKYTQDAYDLHDYRTIHAAYHHPFINHFLATATPENLDIPALLHTAATVRGGDFTYGIAAGTASDDARNVNACSNVEILCLLYILKKCGYLDAIFRALPELPEDFPLLLLCFADTAIRKRVEDYMGIPGLAAMYDLAFAPCRLSVRDQLKLVEFGRNNPRFQELLGASLFRYGYHLHDRGTPRPDWKIQDFAHFRNGFCADVLLFLVSAPDTLPPLRQLLDSGPEARVSLSDGFDDATPCFFRNILGYLVLTGDARLPDWLRRTQEDAPDAAAHKRLKTPALVTALQKLAQS